MDTSDLKGIGSQAAYESFLSAARALEPGFIEECCADVVLAYHNVTHAVEQVLGGGAVSVGRLPNVNIVELSMLPRLVQGLAFAALRVEQELETASFGPLFDRAQALRRKLRRSAEALAEARLLADADVDEVWLHARQDVLEDGSALVALLRRNEPRLVGRSPVTASELQDAERLLGRLATMLGRQDVARQESASLSKAVEMRDRFWTLLSQRYELLWRCGAWLYGRGVDERVPPLPLRRAVVRQRSGAFSALVAPQDLPVVARSEALEPVSSTASAVSSREEPEPERAPGRHLEDLQKTLERKARFLVRIGVTSPPRPT